MPPWDATGVWLTYLLGINAWAGLLYGYDKLMAGRGRRISEAALLAVALAGGSLGAGLAQWAFRHKTRKRDFQRAYRAIVLLHAVAMMAFFLAYDRALLEAVRGLSWSLICPESSDAFASADFSPCPPARP